MSVEGEIRIYVCYERGLVTHRVMFGILPGQLRTCSPGRLEFGSMYLALKGIVHGSILGDVCV
jgi:hypothetical protein